MIMFVTCKSFIEGQNDPELGLVQSDLLQPVQSRAMGTNPSLTSGGMIGRHSQETLLTTVYARLLPKKNLLEV